MKNTSALKILFVDDVKENLLALRALLQKDDVEIFEALSGTAALELLLVHDFALAILDVQMPVMNGFELAELMRMNESTKSIPIIFVTAGSRDKSYVFKGYESGAVDFLYKPLDTHAVKSKVNIFLQLYRQKQQLELQIAEQRLLLDRYLIVKDELRNSVAVREEFMSIASHELKTPLTTLKLHAQLKIRGLKRGDMRGTDEVSLLKLFTSDLYQIEKLNRLIDDMLDVSRITSGKLSMKPERMDLSGSTRDILHGFNDLVLASKSTLTMDICDEAWGDWDKLRIEQVISNLVTNALRYGSGKPIFVQVAIINGFAQLVVRDDGLGIAEEHQKRIFERFERVTDKNEASGLGLGLFIISQILESHGSKIKVMSKLGEGSTFTVSLPLCAS